MRTINFVIITIVAVMGFNFTACSQKSETASAFSSSIDTCYKSFIPDSIVSIIAETKTVKMNIDSSMSDPATNNMMYNCSKEVNSVVKYLLFDDENYRTDTLVKGHFTPWVQVTFEGKKKKSVYLELDFGLWKWRLLDSTKKVICIRDMGTNRKQFLRLVRTIYPSNKKLNEYYHFINK